MKGQTNDGILKPKLQRRLRKNMTDAERRLWRSLQRKQMGNFKFRRQHPFGDYILDFVCLEVMLAVEVDGGQHGEMHEEDAARTKRLKSAGFRVLRFWNNDVLRDIDAVTEAIWQALRTPPPSCPRTAEQCLPATRGGATRQRAMARECGPRASCTLTRSHPRKPGPLLHASARPSP